MKKKTVIEGAFFFHLQSFLILHIHCSLWSHYLASLYSIQLYVSDLSSSNCIHSIKIGKSITVRRLTATVYEGFDSILWVKVFYMWNSLSTIKIDLLEYIPRPVSRYRSISTSLYFAMYIFTFTFTFTFTFIL